MTEQFANRTVEKRLKDSNDVWVMSDEYDPEIEEIKDEFWDDLPTTPPAVPYDAPLNVLVTKVGPTSFNLTWENPDSVSEQGSPGMSLEIDNDSEVLSVAAPETELPTSYEFRGDMGSIHFVPAGSRNLELTYDAEDLTSLPGKTSEDEIPVFVSTLPVITDTNLTETAFTAGFSFKIFGENLDEVRSVHFGNPGFDHYEAGFTVNPEGTELTATVPPESFTWGSGYNVPLYAFFDTGDGDEYPGQYDTPYNTPTQNAFNASVYNKNFRMRVNNAGETDTLFITGA